jgi:hypothetical protein
MQLVDLGTSPVGEYSSLISLLNGAHSLNLLNFRQDSRYSTVSGVFRE